MKHLMKHQEGFTLLELMIATLIFSTVLLLCTFGLIKVGQTYYKGAMLVRTQEVSRDVVDTISQAIQYGSAAPIATGTPPNQVVASATAPTGTFCVGNERFTFARTKVTGTTHGLQVDQPNGGCMSPATSPRELLGDNMRLTEFQVTKNGDDYSIVVKVTYGDDDLINLDNPSDPSYGDCRGGTGSQFCASSRLETTVHRRASS